MKTSMTLRTMGLLALAWMATGAWAASGPEGIQTLYCQIAGTSSLSFDGVDDYVGFTNTTSLQQMTGNITISAWVKMQDINSGKYMGIAGKLSGGRGFALVRHDSNYFRFWTGNGFVLSGINSTQQYTDTDWHHVAGVLSGGVAYLYVDGLLNSQGGSGLTIQDSGDYAFAGRQYSNLTDRYWQGIIDDVRFYKRGLTAQEIVAAMATPAIPDDPGLVGYWPFDEAQGQIVTDVSNNHNNGSLGGSGAVGSGDPTWVLSSLFCQSTGTTYYVNAVSGNDGNNGRTPQTAFATIQRGINAASNGATVLVADGTYRGTGNKELDFGGKAITVKGANGPAGAIIDCQNSGRAFYFHTGEGSGSVVDGLTLQAGNSYSGGAIYCLSTGPTITGCWIKNNTSTLGGAVYCYNGGQPVISHCVFTGNSSTTGGAVRFDNCAGELSNCVLYGNTSSGGGGAIRVDNGSLMSMIRSCTVANNTVTQSGSVGGGLYLRSANATISNCIFWGNTAAGGGLQIGTTSPAALTVRYSDVAGGQSGITGGATVTWAAGNLNADPNFANPTQGDFHLKSARGRYWPAQQVWVLDSVTSPCVDAGDPEDPVADEPLPNGGRINMGAYGGTDEASLSPSGGVGQLECDVNHDGVVNFDDLFALVDQWMQLCGSQVPVF